MVKELRNFNVDLKTIKQLKNYLDKSVYNIGKDSFAQIPEESFKEQMKAQKKLMLPMDESNEIMEDIFNEVTPEGHIDWNKQMEVKESELSDASAEFQEFIKKKRSELGLDLND